MLPKEGKSAPLKVELSFEVKLTVVVGLDCRVMVLELLPRAGKSWGVRGFTKRRLAPSFPPPGPPGSTL